MRHITGESRQQATLLPPTLDGYVDGDHPVRVIDAFVDTLDMTVLGFSKAETCITGRKPYHPGDLLKLYIYGYLNQTRSSRRLEKECYRNLELLWLMKRLAPDFKTISDFRKDNSDAVRGASGGIEVADLYSVTIQHRSIERGFCSYSQKLVFTQSLREPFLFRLTARYWPFLEVQSRYGLNLASGSADDSMRVFNLAVFAQ